MKARRAALEVANVWQGPGESAERRWAKGGCRGDALEERESGDGERGGGACSSLVVGGYEEEGEVDRKETGRRRRQGRDESGERGLSEALPFSLSGGAGGRDRTRGEGARVRFSAGAGWHGPALVFVRPRWAVGSLGPNGSQEAQVAWLGSLSLLISSLFPE